jgi:endonuclease YncB( thermonuclease family)
MFYFLHRLVKWFLICLVLAGFYWVWLQRAALEPVYVWYDVYDNGGIQKTERLSVMEGRGLRMIDGHTFAMNSDNKIYKVRLTGFDIPEPPLSDTEVARERERRRVLHNAIASQKVRLDLTFASNDSLLGVATVNGTNLNLFFLTNGLSKFNPTYIKSAPRDVQYQFFAAERLRKKNKEKKTELAMRSE